MRRLDAGGIELGTEAVSLDSAPMQLPPRDLLAARIHETAALAWEDEVVAAVRERGDRAMRQEADGDAERCLTNVTMALPVNPKRVLEVGIGYLATTTTLREVFGDQIEIHAIEHPNRRALGTEEFQAAVAAQRVHLSPCDLLTDPLPDAGPFDAVFFCDVVEHLPVTRVPDVLDKLAAGIAPGGRLVMSSTNLSAFLRVASLAFGNGMVLDPPFPQEYAGGTYGHIRLYGRADVQLLVEHAGMRLVDWRYTNWERVFLDRDTLARRLVYAAQVVAPRVRSAWATSWSCAAERV